ncbi:MAG TPA: endo-1,4-beta-xylanase [Dehalococcoidia bacterium]|nr:endo-1,4-beta-xylanase [Dehalococcoidia bacterium]
MGRIALALALFPLAVLWLPIPAGATADSPYGVVLVMGVADLRDPSPSLRAMELAAQAGIGWLRLGFPWSWVEGSPGRFNWGTHDALVAKARSLGLQVLGTLGYTAVWASTAPPEVTRAVDRERYPPRDYDAWGRYVYQTVSRYRGQVRYWEVWNEPDLGGSGPFGFWRGTEAEFARLLAVAYQNVKRADPQAVVVLGGLSLGGSPAVLNQDFFPRILRDPIYPAARYFDIAAFHHYGSQETARQRFHYVKSELEKVGAGQKPIWVTEVGITSQPRPQDPPQYRGSEGQARYLRDLLPFLLGLGAEKVFWFCLVDSTVAGPNATTYGLLDPQLSPKPSYFAYRELTGATIGDQAHAGAPGGTPVGDGEAAGGSGQVPGGHVGPTPDGGPSAVGPSSDGEGDTPSPNNALAGGEATAEGAGGGGVPLWPLAAAGAVGAMALAGAAWRGLRRARR